MTFLDIGFTDSMKGITDSFHGNISAEKSYGNVLLSI